MRISRERFIDQFAISIMVEALRVWPRSTKQFPDHMSRAIYDTICVSNGEIPISLQQFRANVEPIIRELHRTTPFRQRLDHNDLTVRVYDALSAAGVEVVIAPPLKAHGGAYGAKSPSQVATGGRSAANPQALA